MLRLPCAGGGQLTRRPTVVSHGGDMVAVCNADRIRIYSALSGEILFTFEGHSDEVTTLCIHPLSEGKVWFVIMHGVAVLILLIIRTRIL